MDREQETRAGQRRWSKVDPEPAAGARSPASEKPDPVEERAVPERHTGEPSAADRESRERRRHIVGQVTLGVDYAFYLLYGLLGIRFVLALLGAAERAGFVQFIHGLTGPFYAPFSGIVTRPALDGGFFDFPLIIALLAYVLLHVAIRGLLRLIAGHEHA